MIPLIDLFALVWLLGLWMGFTWFADVYGRRSEGILRYLHDLRRQWILRMLDRDLRIVDVTIVSVLSRSTAMFASTTVFILAGVLTLFGALDQVRAVISVVSFAQESSRFVWELKLLVLGLIFVYAFFKFVWGMRQFNFGLTVFGAAPMPDEKDQAMRSAYADAAALVIDRGFNSFTSGLRSYYFGLATVTWFFHPALFIGACVIVVMVLYRREFWSRTRQSIALFVDQTKTSRARQEDDL